MAFMLKLSSLLFALTVLAAVIGFSALGGIVGSLAQVLVAAFGALFVVSFAITVASFMSEGPTQ